jgi:hypothetical protein
MQLTPVQQFPLYLVTGIEPYCRRQVGFQEGKATDALAPAKIGLDEALDLDTYFVDTTCVKTNIHYPVDWVLLGDGM